METSIFDKWWKPVIALIAIGLLLFVSIWADISFLQIPSFIIFCIAGFFLVLSLIFQLLKCRWIKALLTFVILCGTVIVCFYSAIALYFIAMNEPDTFADHLKIPTDIIVEDPINMDNTDNKPLSVTNSKKGNIDFQLYNSFQPGLYEYDFWTPKIDSGTIYLKAYEITQNHPLSTWRLPQSSSIKIYNPTDSIVRIGSSSYFKIYEGDWGKAYAARFEVWYKPAIGGQERKLFEKNYKIEGYTH